MDEQKLLTKKQRLDPNNVGEREQLIKVLTDLGELYRQSGQYDNALKTFKQKLNIFEKFNKILKLNEKLDIGITHRIIGDIYVQLENYNEALSHQKDSLDCIKKLNNLVELQRSYASLGRTYFCLSQAFDETTDKRKETLEEAKKFFRKSFEIIPELTDRDINPKELILMKARLLLNMGLIYEAQKKLDKAIDYFKKSADLCKEHRLHQDLHRVYLSWGELHGKQEKYKEALKFYRKSGSVTNDVISVMNARIEESELLVKLGRWLEARKILIELYIKRNEHPQLTNNIIKLLKIVVTITDNESKLLSEKNNSECVKLYEEMGDAAIAGDCYEKAIDYYKKMLAFAENDPNNLKDKKIAALGSLAQTLKDVKRYDEAYNYGLKEYELFTSDNQKSDKCRSALFLAGIMANINEISDLNVCDKYQEAKSIASALGDKRLELKVMKEMYEYFNDTGSVNEANVISKEIEELKLKENLKTDESEDDDDDDNLNDDVRSDFDIDIDIDKLPDIIKLQVNGKKRKKTYESDNEYELKRNKLGETELHVMCKRSNSRIIRTIKNLVTGGHPVNVKDYNGWTPLHEVICSNSDSNISLPIVKFLVESGANVNVTGYKISLIKDDRNLTALHCAAKFGHLSIINFLIESGADIKLKSEKSKTTYDLLKRWIKDNSKVIENPNEYHTILDKLKLTSLKQSTLTSPSVKSKNNNDFKLDKNSDNNNSSNHNNNITSNIINSSQWKVIVTKLQDKENLKASQTNKNENKVVDDDNEENLITIKDKDADIIDLTDDVDENDSGILTPTKYSNSPVEKKSLETSDNNSMPESPKFVKTMDIMETMDIISVSSSSDEDSSLDINDFTMVPVEIPAKSPIQITIDDEVESKDSIQSKNDEILNNFNLSISQSKADEELISIDLTSNELEADEGLNNVDLTSAHPEADVQLNNFDSDKSKPLINNSNNFEFIVFKIIAEHKELRVTINLKSVHGSLYLKLISIVTEHYLKNTNRHVRVVLLLKNGDLLKSDNFSDVLKTSNVDKNGCIDLYAQFIELEGPTITQRYQDICENNSIDFHNNTKVLNALKMCELTDIFYLNNDDEIFDVTFVLQCLTHQKDLKVLNLSGISLYQCGDLLRDALKCLVKLEELYLEGCDIDNYFINRIESVPPKLKILDLSHNPLTGLCQKKIVKLIDSLNYLEILKLNSSELNNIPFSKSKGKSISQTIKTLDISWNKINDDIVEYFLQLNLTILNLSYTGQRKLKDIYYPIFNTIEEVNLSGCDINDSDVAILLKRSRKLTTVIINETPQLGQDTFEMLLSHSPTLKFIDLTGCSLITKQPKPNVKIINPIICSVKIDITSEIVLSWIQLWHGKAMHFQLAPHNFLLKPVNL